MNFNIAIDSPLTYYITILVCIVIVVLLGLYLEDFIYALLSSAYGAYLIVRGFDISFRSVLPNEYVIFKLASADELAQIYKMFNINHNMIIYLLFILLLTLIGATIQRHYQKEKAAKEKQ